MLKIVELVFRGDGDILQLLAIVTSLESQPRNAHVSLANRSR